jgi:hypothetical protein
LKIYKKKEIGRRERWRRLLRRLCINENERTNFNYKEIDFWKEQIDDPNDPFLQSRSNYRDSYRSNNILLYLLLPIVFRIVGNWELTEKFSVFWISVETALDWNCDTSSVDCSSSTGWIFNGTGVTTNNQKTNEEQIKAKFYTIGYILVYNVYYEKCIARYTTHCDENVKSANRFDTYSNESATPTASRTTSITRIR